MSGPIQIKCLNSGDANFKATLMASLSLPSADDNAIDAAVMGILADVKARGDAAVLDYTKRFDRLSSANTATSVADLEISRSDLEKAYLQLPAEQKSALDIAASRVRAYHEQQRKIGRAHV
jgi:histidinol dehydrogenase